MFSSVITTADRWSLAHCSKQQTRTRAKPGAKGGDILRGRGIGEVVRATIPSGTRRERDLPAPRSCDGMVMGPEVAATNRLGLLGVTEHRKQRTIVGNNAPVLPLMPEAAAGATFEDDERLAPVDDVCVEQSVTADAGLKR